MQGRITTMTGETPYVRFGDWIVLLSVLGVVGATVVVIVRPRRRAGKRYVTSSLTAAITPTTTITRAATGAGSRRPKRAPSWPPTIEPTAISAATSQTTCAAKTNSTAATPLAIVASTFLTPLSRCRSSMMKMPSDGEEDHALRGTEVAAVDPGEEDPDVQLDAAVLDVPVRRAATQRSGAAARSRAPHATRIRTGTTSRNTELGSVSSSTPPTIPPVNDALPSTSTRRRWPRSSRR